MNPILRFLASLRSLRNSGAIKTIDQAFDFAKREFGEIDDLFKRQIEQIFKGPVKKAPKPGEGGITSIKNAPKKETPPQESGTIMDRIGAASNRIDEILKEREAMYKPKPETSPLMEKLEKGVETLKQMKQPGMDLATGLTRTAARKILDRAGIQVPDKVDPIEIFIKEFGGDVLGDVQNIAEEMIEIERMGKATKSMDEILEQEGMFNLKRGRTDMPRGYTDEEMEEIKKAIEQEDILLGFDPKDRKPNALGGFNRVGFDEGSPKNKKGIMKVIKKIPKVGKIAGGLEAAYNTLSKKYGPDVLKTADEIPPKEPSELAKAVKGFEARNPRKTEQEEMEEFYKLNEQPSKEFTIKDMRPMKLLKPISESQVDAIIQNIKKLDPLDAMKEVNKVVKRDGFYKDLSDKQSQKIFDDTQDHIFEREYKPSEFEMNVDEAYGVTPDMKKELDVMKDLGATKTAERFELKERFPGIDDRLLTQIIDDPDPQRKAEAIATIDQAFELMRQGKSPDQILDIMKKMTDRTKQAGGGLSYLMGM